MCQCADSPRSARVMGARPVALAALTASPDLDGRPGSGWQHRHRRANCQPVDHGIRLGVPRQLSSPHALLDRIPEHRAPRPRQMYAKPLHQLGVAALLGKQHPQKRHRVAQSEVAAEVLQDRQRAAARRPARQRQRLGAPCIDNGRSEGRAVPVAPAHAGHARARSCRDGLDRQSRIAMLAQSLLRRRENTPVQAWIPRPPARAAAPLSRIRHRRAHQSRRPDTLRSPTRIYSVSQRPRLARPTTASHVTPGTSQCASRAGRPYRRGSG
jgi:hypothetical protein